MKIKWFVLLLFTLVQAEIFARTFNLNLYADGDKNFAGDFSYLLGEIKFAYNGKDELSNIGVSLSTGKISKALSFVCKTGNLSAGGALSRMNSPLLSGSAVPFSTASGPVDCVTSNLSGYTSFTNPLRLFLQLGNWENKNAPFQWTANYLYSFEENNSIVSLKGTGVFFDGFLKLNATAAAGVFPYKANSFTSNFSFEELCFSPGRHLSCLYSLSASLPDFCSTFTLNQYESPFGKFSYLYRLDNKLNTNHFVFSFSALYNPNYMEEIALTSSGKKLAPCLQFKGNLQYKYTCGKHSPVFIKTGLASYLNINLADSQNNFNSGAGLQINSRFTSFIFSITSSFLINSENKSSPQIQFDSAAFKLKNSWNIAAFTPGANVSISLNPSKNFDILTSKTSMGLSLSYLKNPAITGSGSISLTGKNGEITSKKAAGSISAKICYGFITFIFKLSGNMEL